MNPLWRSAHLLSVIFFLPSVQFAYGDTVAWQPAFRFQNAIFPSYILASATLTQCESGQEPRTGQDDCHYSVGVQIITPKDGAKVKLEISIPGFAPKTVYTVKMNKAGEKVLLRPRIAWNYKALEGIIQPTIANIEIDLSIDEKPIGRKLLAIRIHSVNDAPFMVVENGKSDDYFWMYSAYVNENHPLIDQVLRATLNLPVKIVDSWVGYQRGPQEVVNQVFAIWYFFQRNGFTYSSITTPSGAENGVFSQHVRFLEDSLRTKQANCVDGTVLFASILRKIGIEPFLVLIPGHMFLGFWADQAQKQPALLETTLMNSGPFNNRRPSELGNNLANFFQVDPNKDASAVSFNNAIRYATSEFNANRAKFNKVPTYRTIFVYKARQLGIMPINH